MDAQAEYPRLFSPATVAGLSLANRIVMPPMATAMEVGSDQFEAWYAARARGGPGLIIMEALGVRRLCDDKFCERLEPAVQAIHAHGVPVVLQLFAPSVTCNGDVLALSPTPRARAAREDELARVAVCFGQAAARCRELGFDGVEPHGAHGFFLNQAFSPLHNCRTDHYGGSLEGRMSLALEIVAAIRHEAGEDYPLLYRHTPVDGNGGYSLEDSLAFLRCLVGAGVQVLDISPSGADGESEHCCLAAAVRQDVEAPVIAVGGMEDPARAEAALEAGKCDLCAVGRQLIADPDWPQKMAEGRLDEVIQCVKCDEKCYGNLRRGTPIGCTENPRSGNEYRLL